MLLTGLIAKSQTPHFVYTYDNNGNRIQRQYIPLKMSQDTVVTDSNSTVNTIDSASIAAISQTTQQQQYEAMLGEQKITVYPNPTKGELQIDITNFATGSKGFIYVTDLQGRVIYRNENINSTNILNLSSVVNGEYILKIVMNNTSKEWIIVKE